MPLVTAASTWGTRLLWLLAAAAILLLAAWLLVGAVERRLTFFPWRPLTLTPGHFGVDFQDVIIPTGDGERLHGWWIAGEGCGTVLYFHGNGGNISQRAAKMAVFHRLGLAVLIIDYRGYGQSTGKPSEEGLARDARAAYRWATAERGIRPEEIVIWGKSLGGAVAARLAAEVPCRAVVLEAAFTRAADMAPRMLPWLPLVGHLLHQRWDTVAAVGAITVPRLFIHGTDDEVVPFDMGVALYRGAPGRKRFLAIPGAHHTDAWEIGGDAYACAVSEFVAQALGTGERCASRGGLH